MNKDQLSQRLMATFLEEMDEHVHTLNSELLLLEKQPSAEEQAAHLLVLFRTVHSLKGAARSVNISLIEQVCHLLEEILAWAQKGFVDFDKDVFALLFGAADALDEAAMRLREQQSLNDAPLATLLPRLQDAVHKRLSRLPAFDPPRDAERLLDKLPMPSPDVASELASLALERPEPVPAENRREPVSGAATVRVPAEKLDALLGRSAELLVARQRVLTRAKQFADLRDLTSRWRRDSQMIEKTLKRLLHAMSDRPAEALPALHRPGELSRGTVQALSRQGDALREAEKDLDQLIISLAGDSQMIDRAARALDDEVRRLRMFPFAEACQGLDRMTRDLAQAARKDVEFVIEGGEVALDRSVLEGLKDPLMHLVRNALDHGVEPPQERQKAGKRVRARITVSAVLRGSQVEINVADDGRGLHLEELRDAVRKRGLPEPADDRELARLVFLPGISTTQVVTDLSGRGIGLEAVKSRVESLHGTIDMDFAPGQGTRFSLAVPLTLTIVRALLVGAGGQPFAFVGTNVEKLARVRLDSIRSVEGRDMVLFGAAPIPIASLSSSLGLANQQAAGANGTVAVAVIRAGEKRMAFVVDELLSEQEIVIKAIGPRIRNPRYASGAAILPSGKIALVLNATNLVQNALLRKIPGRVAAKPAEAVRRRIILAEDSLTTRTLEKHILETAGYEVLAAPDGEAAWRLLQERGADVLVSDIEMPRMDGFALTERVRASKRFQKLPVVLVTARQTERDKARGAEVGADAYLVKSGFDQRKLLEAIAKLL
jgi:two-component system, chemotaxis family, sensor kinase CheA